MARGNAMAREDRIRLLLSINDATGMPRAQPGTDSAPWPTEGRPIAMFGPGACPLHEGLACPVECRRWRRQPAGCGSISGLHRPVSRQEIFVQSKTGRLQARLRPAKCGPPPRIVRIRP